jgi:phage gpG-like protein
MKKIINNIIKDVKVELDEEFDRNFERKGFFGEKWKQTKHPNSRGSLMMRSGNLRRGQRSTMNSSGIRYTNSMPYASIHNEGGEITVTPQMKKFFWAMYYKSSGAISGRGTERDQAMNAESQKWKNLALMKVGKRMKIEQRQFVGDHPQVRKLIRNVVYDSKAEIVEHIKNQFKQ